MVNGADRVQRRKRLAMKLDDSVFVDGALAYRPEAAAKLLGVSRRTLDSWAADGLIRPLKVGPGRAGLVLYPRTELVAFLAREAVSYTHLTLPTIYSV